MREAQESRKVATDPGAEQVAVGRPRVDMKVMGTRRVRFSLGNGFFTGKRAIYNRRRMTFDRKNVL